MILQRLLNLCTSSVWAPDCGGSKKSVPFQDTFVSDLSSSYLRLCSGPPPDATEVLSPSFRVRTLRWHDLPLLDFFIGIDLWYRCTGTARRWWKQNSNCRSFRQRSVLQHAYCILCRTRCTQPECVPPLTSSSQSLRQLVLALNSTTWFKHWVPYDFLEPCGKPSLQKPVYDASSGVRPTSVCMQLLTIGRIVCRQNVFPILPVANIDVCSWRLLRLHFTYKTSFVSRLHKSFRCHFPDDTKAQISQRLQTRRELLVTTYWNDVEILKRFRGPPCAV